MRKFSLFLVSVLISLFGIFLGYNYLDLGDNSEQEKDTSALRGFSLDNLRENLLISAENFNRKVSRIAISSYNYFSKSLEIIKVEEFVQIRTEFEEGRESREYFARNRDTLDDFAKENANLAACIGSESMVFIPSLNICAPVKFKTSWERDGYMSVLQNGVAHMDYTALPGESGTSYIAGHSSSPLGYSRGPFDRVFVPLIDVEIGSEVFVKSGKEVYLYKINETRIVEPTDLSVIPQDIEEKKLSLITCWPINTSQKRFAAIAEMEELKDRTSS